MNAGERRNMRMRTWALMDRTPIAQMHTILRVWVLATENKLFEDLREKYEARKIRKEDSVAVTGKKDFEDESSVSLSTFERTLHVYWFLITHIFHIVCHCANLDFDDHCLHIC